MRSSFETWHTQVFMEWLKAEPHPTHGHFGPKYVRGSVQRKGQFYYNALYAERPELVGVLTEDTDPFYNDALIPDFLSIVAEMWWKVDEPARSVRQK